MKLNINTTDGGGYSITLNDVNSIDEVIKYINTHAHLVGTLTNGDKTIVIATDKITTIIY